MKNEDRPMRPAAAILLSAAVALAGQSAVAAPACQGGAHVAAACFTVHATLRPANGSPGLRLYPRGSKRILGVFDGNHSEETPHIVPANVEAAATPPLPGAWNAVTGDYRVCPLARQRPGRMQPVCIDFASHLAVLPRRGAP